MFKGFPAMNEVLMKWLEGFLTIYVRDTINIKLCRGKQIFNMHFLCIFLELEAWM